ncbi:MAG TPA: LysR substrate-binding domain-containing protein [Xanthobacteraceae bacterium]|nr:LysR substrate-binding domain-containing protein [Xanthobacteraceae bacterium]
MTIPRNPPFKSIEAFVTAARVLSFTEAASALNITLPAVSRRIQALERDLGMPLFQRKHRTLVLTHAGESYFADLEPAIDAIRRASLHMRAGTRSRTVKLNLPESLAASWLLPRLHHFRATHRDIHLELESNGEHRELETIGDHNKLQEGETDIVIRIGDGCRPGLRTERLLDLAGFPVCSPSLMVHDGVLGIPDDLEELPLLGIKGRPELWREWFHSAGLNRPTRIAQEFDNPHLLYRAAVCGLGVAFGVDVLVQPYLDDGQLVRPFNSQCKLNHSYYVVCRGADLSRRPISIFRNWLMRQAGGEAAQL